MPHTEHHLKDAYNEISRQACSVFDAITSKWQTNAQIVARSGVNENTVKQHTRRMCNIGIIESFKTTELAYRLKDSPDGKAAAIIERLKRASEVYAEIGEQRQEPSRL